MACSEARQLQAYVDADLSLPERARLDEHLGRCGGCRQELAELQQLESLLAELSPTAPPSGFTAQTLLRARQELRRPRQPAATWAAAMTVASAAAAIFMFILHAGPIQQSPPLPTPVAAMADTAPARPQVIHHSMLVTSAATPLIPTPSPRRIAISRSEPRRTAVSQPRSHPSAVAALPTEKAAAAAYSQATRDANGDPDLTVAALENVAATYPRSRQAAKALLAAGSFERRRGNLAEADGAYRRVLALSSQSTLTQALAHQALGDLRRQSVGDDEVALYHYTQAARALRAQGASRDGQALVVLADVEKATGQRDLAAADYAAVVNSGGRSSAVEHSSTALAEVL